MKSKMWSLWLALLLVVAPLALTPQVSYAQSNGIEFKITYDSGTGVYDVYMRPSVTPASPNETTTSQVTIKVPHGTGGNRFEPQPAPLIVPGIYLGDKTGPLWGQGSRVDTPTEDPNADYISFDLTIGPTPGAFAWAAGTEVRVFSFTNTGACQGAVTLLENSDPFMPPNSAGTNPGNQIAVRGIGTNTDNDYIGTYGGPANCSTVVTPDSDGDGLADDVDTDDDNDGILDTAETGDTDGDGLPDSLESNIIDTDGDGNADYNDSNADGDGEGPDGTGGEEDGVLTGPWNDNDGDGIPAHLDPNDATAGAGDADNDGINDDVECPGGYLCPDSDGDGQPDYMDTDSDNDGVSDQTEGTADTDSDGLPDRVEPNDVDTDGDGNMNQNDADDDGDTVPTNTEGGADGDPTDDDADSDGIPDHLDKANGNGSGPTLAGSGDSDGDGIPDGVECTGGIPCPDSDGDGQPDYMDTDSDNDGVSDQTEGAADTDSDGLPDRVEPNDVDTDGDGNMNQNDADDDGDTVPTNTEGGADGDPTDDDADNDGIPDHLDKANGNGSGPTLAGSGDSDGDGIPDGVECAGGIPCPDSDGDGTPDYMDMDSDNDGVSDQTEGATDSDSDGLPDRVEPNNVDTDGDGNMNQNDADDDGDTVPTNTEGGADGDSTDDDADSDGIPDHLDKANGNGSGPTLAGSGDSDGDGIPDGVECAGGIPCPDSDGDGTPDYMDMDSDNDGVSDQTEGATDSDSDGLPDRVEPNNVDTDGDGNMNQNDADDDGDTVPTNTEGGADGDSTDDDADSDGIPDHLDKANGNGSGPTLAGSGDSDGDGIPDGVECAGGIPCPDSDGDGTPDYMDMDSDNDGVSDQTEGATDSDSDGLPDRVEPNNVDTDGDGNMNQNDADDDGDTVPTNTEGGADGDSTDDDADSDGIPDHLDKANGNGSGPTLAGSGDSDGDGIPDGVECPGGIPCPDNDNNGTPDYMQGAGGDSDGDSIPDAVEAAGPNGGDANNDGTPDKDQASVGTLLASDNFSYITAEVTGACNTIGNLDHLTEAEVATADTLDYPFGLMAIRLDCQSAGQSATVKYYWHAVSDLTGLPYRKYGPMTPGGSSDVWYDFPVTYGTASPAGLAIATSTMLLTDGAQGDDTAADGVISDPSGPANTTQKSTLGDWVWFDVNGNGVKDVNEQGINGVIINLYLDTGDGVPQPGELVTTTTTVNDGSLLSGLLIDSDDALTGQPGAYDFQVLDNQTYIVEIDPANFLPDGALENYIYTGENASNAYNGADPRVVLIGVQQDYNDADFPFTLPASLMVDKQLNTVNSVVRPGDTVSFTIRITNTGSITITTLPLQDRYNSAFLQFDSGNAGNSPAPDSAAPGQLNWSNLAPVNGLAPQAVMLVDVYFTALADTTLLVATAPCTTAGEAPNVAEVMNAVADPDGAGAQPSLAVTDSTDCASVRIEQPTAVHLTDMGVSQTAEGVLVQWTTVTELDIVGFRVLHSNGLRVNEVTPAALMAASSAAGELIPAKNAGQSSGAAYRVLDAGVTLSRGDVYVLETVRADGSSERNVLGVFSSNPVYLPLIER